MYIFTMGMTRELDGQSIKAEENDLQLQWLTPLTCPGQFDIFYTVGKYC